MSAEEKAREESKWKMVLLKVHWAQEKPTLCLCFSPDVNSNGASPLEGTSLQSDILPDPDPGRPGSAWPVLAKITFDGVVVTVLNHTTQPKINEKTMLVSHPKWMPFPQEVYLNVFPDILFCLNRAIVEVSLRHCLKCDSHKNNRKLNYIADLFYFEVQRVQMETGDGEHPTL